MKNSRISACAIAALAGLATAQDTGPSTTWEANLLPIDAGVRTISLLSVGDSVNTMPDGITPYRMVGIPDGIGAFDNGDDTFTVVMNHELGGDRGVVRAHGATGAFVSKWIINKNTFEVLSGEDLIQNVGLWNTTTNSYDMGASAFSRFCSGDLGNFGSFFNPTTGMGTNEMIYLTGEENGAGGRAFATFVTGDDKGSAFELAYLGNTSFENVVANPQSGDSTIVAALDDSTGGQLYFYYGTKANTGTDLEKSGLLGGVLYGLAIEGVANTGSDGIDGLGSTSMRFSLANLGDVSALDGDTIETMSVDNGITGYARPEDGAWVTSDPNKFVFVTTGSGDRRTRLWLVTFDDVNTPSAGGTIEILLEGDTDGLPVDMDNLTVDDTDQVLIQEDPGSSSLLARIWNYSLTSGALTELAAYDATYFQDNGQPEFITTNEESSGIVSLKDILGDGWFVASSQVHADAGDTELVENGQLLLMYSAIHNACPADFVADFEALNFFDVSEFVRAFIAGEGKADLAEPYGELDMFDVTAYIEAYNNGCN